MTADPFDGRRLPGGAQLGPTLDELARACGSSLADWLTQRGADQVLGPAELALAAYAPRAGLSAGALELADRLAAICEAARGPLLPVG